MGHLKKYSFLPLAVLLIIYPICVHGAILQVPFASYAWFPNVVEWQDYFLVYRKYLLYILAIIMVIIIAVSGELRAQLASKNLLPFYLFGIWVVLSTIVSEYRTFGIHGIIYSQQTVFVRLSYLVLAIYTYVLVKSGLEPERLYKYFLIGLYPAGILALGQFLGKDFWISAPGRAILFLGSGQNHVEMLESTYDVGQSYGGFYNPKYAGIYFLGAGVIVAGHLLRDWTLEKNRNTDEKRDSSEADIQKRLGFSKSRIVDAVGLFLCVIGIIGSKSKTVYIALPVLIACVFIQLFYRKKGKQNNIYLLTFLVSAALVVIYLMVPVRSAEEYALDDLALEDDKIILTYDGEIFTIEDAQTSDGYDYPLILNEQQELFHYTKWEDGRYHPEEEKYKDLSFLDYQKDDYRYLMVFYRDIPFRFIRLDGEWKFLSLYGKITDFQTAPNLLPGRENRLTGRGYIWGRALWLILKHPIFGTGPESFLLTFPQEDYVKRAQTGLEFYTQMIGNAHSMYLQVASEMGILALILLLWILLGALALKNPKTDETGGFNVAKMALLGFVICGFTWAINLSIAPFFWILTGMIYGEEK